MSIKTLFIEQGIANWQKADSFFWICYFSSKLSYHGKWSYRSYQQGFCLYFFGFNMNVCKKKWQFNVWLFLINVQS